MKDKRSLFDTDDRAVSPVIGVILMVAITVILAAVIGTFVLDLGQDLQDDEAAPSLAVDANTHSDLEMGAEDSFDTNDRMPFATISHETGDSLDATDIEIQLVDENDIAVAELNATEDDFEYLLHEETDALQQEDGTPHDVELWMTAEVGDEIGGGDTVVIELEERSADDGYTHSEIAVADGSDENGLEASTEYTFQIVHEPSGSVVAQSDILLPAAD